MKTLEIREREAFAIAREIDRLAYLVDPVEYFDAVGRSEEDIQANVDKIATDIFTGNSDEYFHWLWELSEDANLDERDRERARDRLYRLIDYATSF